LVDTSLLIFRKEILMPAHEIPRQEWPLFLGNFGYRHFGWEVTLEQKRPGCGKRIADHHFLQEVTSERADGREQITIVLGAPFAPHQTHVVDNPQRVRVALGREEVLEIDCGNGITVVIHVRRNLAA
jgi:hypothetical protein